MINDPNQFETRLRAVASRFNYPPTPARAASRPRRVQRPRLRYAVALVLAILILVLFSVPQVRAGIIEVLQIGAVRIFLVAPTPMPTLTPDPSVTPTITPARPPTATPLSSLPDQLSGEVTLSEARRRVNFTIRLPATMPAPDRVFLQDMGAPVVILVWVDQGQVSMSLHLLARGGFGAGKIQPKVIRTTTVSSIPALWTEGPYLLQTRFNNLIVSRLIEGHVLIWVEGDVTYRLETALAMDEAVKIAESLK